MENCTAYDNATHSSNIPIQARETEEDQSKKFIVLAICIILIVSIIPGNLSVFYFTWKKNHFSSNFSVYATSLAIADLSVGLIVLPLELMRLLQPDWFISAPMCIFSLLVEFGPASVSIFLLDAIAYDRYMSVTSPLLYRHRFTKARSIAIAMAMWSLGFLVWIPYCVCQQLDDIYNARALGSCDSNFGYVKLGQAVLAYYLPIVFVVVLYILIQRALRKRTIMSEYMLTRRKVYMVENELKQVVKTGYFDKTEIRSDKINDNIFTRQGTTETQHQPGTTASFSTATRPSGNPVDIHHTTLSVGNLPRSLGADSSETESREHLQIRVQNRSDSRAYSQICVQNRTCLKTISVVIIVFLLCWVPFCVLWPMNGHYKSRVFDLFYTIFAYIAYGNSAFNPFIYVFTSKSIRSEFLKCCARGDGVR